MVRTRQCRGTHPPFLFLVQSYQKENLRGKCLNKNIIFQATIQENISKKEETYIGLASTTFKERLGVHRQSFRNRNLNQTTLSRYLWALKDQNIHYSLKFSILARAKPYSSKFKQCGLCNKERFFIITQPLKSSLNRRNELTSKCMHRDKFLLSNFTP